MANNTGTGLGKINIFDSSALSTNGELNSPDYQNFLKLPSEKQAELVNQGLKFDEFGNTYGANTNTGTSSEGMFSGITNLFTPDQKTGTSTGGNILKGASDAVGAIGGLGQLYFTKKNYDLQKENQDYLKDREKQNDRRLTQFAQNAGNGAMY